MAYRINTNGILETDSAEEALAFLTLCAKTKTPVVAAAAAVASTPTKRTYTRRQAAPAAPGETDEAVRSRRPTLAVQFGVKIGQIWRKRWGADKNRAIQIAQLKADGIIPKVLQAGGTKKTQSKYMSYSHLATNYALVKDV